MIKDLVKVEELYRLKSDAKAANQVAKTGVQTAAKNRNASRPGRPNGGGTDQSQQH